jgi:hypothetical protein
VAMRSTFSAIRSFFVEKGKAPIHVVGVSSESEVNIACVLKMYVSISSFT